MTDANNLTECQLNAINWEHGPLLVLGGAGSGKTHALAHRIAWVYEESSYESPWVLGLVTSERAAFQLHARVRKLLNERETRWFFTTIESVAEKIVRRHGHSEGIENSRKLCVLKDKSDRLLLLDEVMNGSKHGNYGLMSEKILPLFDRLSELKFVSADEVCGWLSEHSFSDSEFLTSTYLQYKNLMKEKNFYDIPGIVSEYRSLYIKSKGLMTHINKIYTHIYIDDFQVNSNLYCELLEYLVNPKTRNLFVLADDKRIFKQENEACYRRMLKLVNDYGMSVCQFPTNRQCPDNVVWAANELTDNIFDRNRNLCYQSSKRERAGDSSINFLQFERLSDELEWLAKDVACHDPEARSNCVVFAGTRQLLKQAVEALKEHGVEGYLPDDDDWFDSPSMVWFHSVLKLAVSRTNQEYLTKVCKSFELLTGIELEAWDIAAHASVEEEDYLRSWAIAVLSAQNSTHGIRNLISESLLPQLTEKFDFRGFQNAAFKWLDELDETDSEPLGCLNEYKAEKSIWEQKKGEIEANHESVDSLTLHTFLREIDQKFKPPSFPDNGTPCLTLNTFRTMKFDHVYIIGLLEGLCPGWVAIGREHSGPEFIDVNIEMHRERRNCFLALTRARKSVTLTCSSSMNDRKMEPSRFIEEMGMLNLKEEHRFEDEQFKSIAVAG